MAYETEITVQLTPLGTLQSTDVITVPSTTAVFASGGTLDSLSDVSIANLNPRDVLTFIDANTGWQNRPIDTLSIPANASFNSIFANTANIVNLSVSGTINRNPTITINLLGDVSGSGSTTLTNLQDGTLDITTTVIGGGSGGVNTAYVDNKAANAYSNAVVYTNILAAAAYSNAVANAASNANTRANQAYTNAVSYADTKASVAYSNAVVAAASDATTKAAIAYANAIAYAASNTYVNNQLTLKANLFSPSFTGTVTLPAVNANGSVGTAGQVLTSNGSSVYWNTPGTGSADQAYTNAVSIATSLASNAYSNAVSVAATDATNKANQAYSNAVAAAATDASTKAATAYSNAVSVAAADATTKSNQAYTNAVTYAVNIATVAYSNAVSAASSDATTKANQAYSNAVAYAASNTYVNNQLALKANTTNPVFAGNVTIATLVANNSTGSTGQILYSNGSVIYWDSPPVANGSVGTLDQVLASGNTTTKALTVGPLTVNGSITAAQVIANGTQGTANFVLASGGSNTIYWRDITSELNVKAGNSYVTTALSTKADIASPTFTGTVTIPTLSANGSTGTVGQVLTSSGSGLYWANAAGFANGQDITVRDVFATRDVGVSGGIVANGTFGTAGQVLTTNGTKAYWSTPAVANGSVGTLDQVLAAGNTTNKSLAVGNITSANLTTQGDVQFFGNSIIYIGWESKLWAGGSIGSNGQVLTSNGSGVNWTTPATGSGGFTNGQSISVANFTASGNTWIVTNINSNKQFTVFSETTGANVLTATSDGIYVNTQFNVGTSDVYLNRLYANNSKGVAGQVLMTSGSGGVGNVYWSDAVNTNASYTWSNNHNFNGFVSMNGPSFSATTNTVHLRVSSNFMPMGPFYANNSTGTPGQVLATNGSNVYWTTASSTLDQTLATGNTTNRGMYVGVVTAGSFVANGTFAANGTLGLSGQVLTSSGAGVYWANVSSGGFTNGQSISVSNVIVTNTATVSRLSANGSTGTSGQVLTTNGTTVYWSTPAGGSSVGSLDDVLAVGNTTTKALTVGPITTPKIQSLVTTKINATSVVAHDLNTASLFYHTTPLADFTINFINPPANNTSSIARIVISQGATPYMPTAIQINGVAEDIAWADGVVPGGNANQYDLVTFELINLGSGWIIFGKADTWATIQELQDSIPRGDYEVGSETFDLHSQVALTLDLNS